MPVVSFYSLGTFVGSESEGYTKGFNGTVGSAGVSHWYSFTLPGASTTGSGTVLANRISNAYNVTFTAFSVYQSFDLWLTSALVGSTTTTLPYVSGSALGLDLDFSGLTTPGNYRLNIDASRTNSTRAAGYGGTVSISPVPEPETYAMMLAGLGLLGFSARRRNKNI